MRSYCWGVRGLPRSDRQARGPPDVREVCAALSVRPEAESKARGGGGGWGEESASVGVEGVPSGPWRHSLPSEDPAVDRKSGSSLPLPRRHHPRLPLGSSHLSGGGTGQTDWVPDPFWRRGTARLWLQRGARLQVEGTALGPTGQDPVMVGGREGRVGKGAAHWEDLSSARPFYLLRTSTLRGRYCRPILQVSYLAHP